MVKVKKDLTGKRIDKLTVLYQTEDYVTPKGIHHARWHCLCDCGNECNIVDMNLNYEKHTKSCGCLLYETLKKVQEANIVRNAYDLSGEYGIGFTSNTNKEFYFDLEDYDLIKDYCWHEDIMDDGYVRLRTVKTIDGKRHSIVFQKLIGFSGCDHKNRNPLDNRKENLRIATISQNNVNKSLAKNNTSGVTGVTYRKDNGKWRAFVRINYNKIDLGSFVDKEDAIRARLLGEKQYYGEFAPQKHLFEQYGID